MSDVTRQSLQTAINSYVMQGYLIQTQTDTMAVLVKPKKFSWVMFFLLIGVFYVPFYMMKKDQRITITVDATGKVYIN